MKSFYTINQTITLKMEKESLEYDLKAFSSEDSYIYVIDTNSLLKIFQMDGNSKKILKDHLKEKIYYGTKQIEKEFLRNKDYISHYYNDSLVKKMNTDFSTIVKSALDNFVKQYAYIISEDDTLSKKLSRLTTTINNLSPIIQKTQNKYSPEKTNEIILSDLTIISDNIDFSTTLDDDEYKQLKDEYNNQIQIYRKILSDNKKEIKNQFRAYIFPSCGEKKEFEPEGDYLIYHEIVKLCNTINKDIIFLTNDTTKNDWVNSEENREYEHYKCIFHELTGHTIKIQNFNNYLSSIGIETERLEEWNEDIYDDEFIKEFLMYYSEFENSIRTWATKNNTSCPPVPRIIFKYIFEQGIINSDQYDNFIFFSELKRDIFNGRYFKQEPYPVDIKNSIIEEIQYAISFFS